ncbi:MAG TPA: hypothetical protein ENK46_14870 [Flavobacteriia bacterium]|nr:hypothetical protein [Flavobacteriia bacterium]
MRLKIGSYITFGKRFCGVEHTFTDGQEILRSLVLAKKKGELLLENTLEVTSIEALKEQLAAKQHLFLIINTEQVLCKELDGIYESSKAVGMAFPNVVLDDFFYELLVTDNHTYVAICRKDVIENIIKTYHENQFRIIGFSLGNVVASQLVGFVKNRLLKTSNGVISFNHQKITGIHLSEQASKEKYTINGLQISSNEVLPLSGILAYFTKRKTAISNFSEYINALYIDFKSRRIFEVGLRVGLGLIFTSLLVSFLFFSYYASKIAVLESELALNKTQRKALLSLTESVQKKEGLITRFSATSSKASWYLDQLGASVPTSVSLSELRFQPLVKKIGSTTTENTEVVVEHNAIYLKGTTTDNNNFSSWIESLEQQNWIDKITIQHYGSKKKMTSAFELLIRMKP